MNSQFARLTGWIFLWLALLGGLIFFAYFAGWDFALTGARDIPYFIVPILAPIVGACFGGWLYPRVIGAYLPIEGQGCTIPNQCDTEEAEQAQA